MKRLSMITLAVIAVLVVIPMSLSFAQSEPVTTEPLAVPYQADGVTEPLTTADEAETILLTNQLRANLGLNCLADNDLLGTASFDHSKDMHDRDFFAHTNPDGQTPGDRATEAGYNWNAIAENIAAGYGSPAAAIAGWRSSRGHYSGMIGPNYEDIGLGIFDGGANSSSDFSIYWTMKLGRTATSTPANCPADVPAITQLPTSVGATGINTPTPDFTWTQDTTTTASRLPASHFDVELINTDTFETVIKASASFNGPVYPVAGVCNGTSCSLRSPIELTNGEYRLFVRSYSQDGGYVWAENSFDFTLNITATAEPTEDPTAEPTEEPTADPTEDPTAEPTEDPTEEPTATADPTEEPTQQPTIPPTPVMRQEIPRIAPADGLALTSTASYTPNFQWEDIGDVEWYGVYVSTPDFQTVFQFQWYEASEVCDSGICTATTPIWLVGDGEFAWWMTYWSDGDGSAFLDRWHGSSFSLNFPAPGDLSALTATAETVNGTTTLQWEAPTNALWYRVWVGPEDFSETSFINWENGADICSGDTCTLELPVTLPAGTYEFWLQAWNPVGLRPWTEMLNFTP